MPTKEWTSALAASQRAHRQEASAVLQAKRRALGATGSRGPVPGHHPAYMYRVSLLLCDECNLPFRRRSGFAGGHRNLTFCSAECRRCRWARRSTPWTIQSCSVCGLNFVSARPARYCSVGCMSYSSLSNNNATRAKGRKGLLERQGYACAICGKLLPPGGGQIDHCHVSDRVRGILCHACNHGLGSLQEDPDLLEHAALYLRTHGSAA
jgi:hypothetical protein